MRNNKPIWVVRFVVECLTPIMDEDALTMLGLPHQSSPIVFLSLQIFFVELHDELEEIFHDFVLAKILTCAKHIPSFIQENSKHRASSPTPPHLDLYQYLSHTTNVNRFPIPTPKQEKLDNIK
jgi:hypothetical protein